MIDFILELAKVAEEDVAPDALAAEESEDGNAAPAPAPAPVAAADAAEGAQGAS